MESVLYQINVLIWGAPVLTLVLALGILLTVRSKASQLTLFPTALRHFCKNIRGNHAETNTISGYRALCTALAATVGTGNLAGVAGAISIGGPGAVFWIWICGFLGMITKCAEVTLSLRFREKDNQGEYVGGPMYIIKNGLSHKTHYLGHLYCFFGVIAALGIGNAVQINAVTDGFRSIVSSLNREFTDIHALFTGLLICVILAPVLLNGASGIGKAAEILVPFASVLYILLAGAVLVIKAEEIPSAFHSILRGALSPRGITCGAIGSFLITMRTGISRGVFTNEAGMGTASIAHAASNVEEPVEQGLMGIIEVFLDTHVICTLTAFVILCSGIQIPFGADAGIRLTMDAFSNVLGDWCRILLTILTCIFAVATVLGWGLYGARCSQFLFGECGWSKFVMAQLAAIVLGAVLRTSVVWTFSEILNGLMAIPNLFAMFCLQDVFISAMEKYRKKAYRP